MAYTTATMRLLFGGLGAAPSLWTYTTADVHTDVDASGYFSDGASKGLKANDIVIVIDTNASKCTIHRASSATTIDAATLS